MTVAAATPLADDSCSCDCSGYSVQDGSSSNHDNGSSNAMAAAATITVVNNRVVSTVRERCFSPPGRSSPKFILKAQRCFCEVSDWFMSGDVTFRGLLVLRSWRRSSSSHHRGHQKQDRLYRKIRPGKVLEFDRCLRIGS
jgi:hypothetical protein